MGKKANQDNFSIRVAAYIRVSTEEQKFHGLSVEAQTTALEDWANKNDLKIVQFYNDAGFSARKPYHKRPAMVKLLEDVEANKIDLIIFTKLDRWFRSLPDYFKVQEILEKNNVNWRTIQEDYDTTTASGRLKVNIMLSVAQDEADRTSERIKAINEMKRQKLQALTGESPFGYKIVDKKFVKDPETEEAVSAFFKKFLDTGSISAARDHIRENFGQWWSYQKAHRILDMPCYHGYYFGIEGMTPPYITKEQYQKIQSMRRRIVRKTAHNRVYIFSGLISCGECGARMGGRVNTKQETYFYNCHSHYLHATDCQNNVNMTEKKIERYMLDTIEGEMEQLEINIGKLSAPKKKKDFQGDISYLKTKVKKLKDLYLNDLIDLDEYKKDKELYEKKIAELEEQSKPIETPNLEKAKKILQFGWKATYNGLKSEEKREFWRILVKEIRIYPDRHIEYDINA